MLKANTIAARIADTTLEKRLVVAPTPDVNSEDSFLNRGAASLDLRLGCWFSVLRSERIPSLDVVDAGHDVASSRYDGKSHPPSSTKMHFVRFGEAFILHPRCFVLGVTLEWIRLPADIGAYVTSRSSWGRRGLIIATAVGIHPEFTGCLTLELSNVGEVPIHLYPGMQVCQIFFHRAEDMNEENAQQNPAPNAKSVLGRFVGKRNPLLGAITKLQDPTFMKLCRSGTLWNAQTQKGMDASSASSLPLWS